MMKTSNKYSCRLKLSDAGNDFGYAEHCSYLVAVFKVNPPPSMAEDYSLIADDLGVPTHHSVRSAVNYLYSYFAYQLNQRFADDGSPEHLFIFITNFVNGLTDFCKNETTERLDIESINYQQLFEDLKLFKLRAIVGGSKEPHIRIVDTTTKRFIFQIRITKTKSWTALTKVDHNFELHLEVGITLETVLNPTEPQ